jgi:hypothetical protein
MPHVTIYISENDAVKYGYFPECSFTGLLIARSKQTIEIINRSYGILQFSTKDIERIEY